MESSAGEMARGESVKRLNPHPSQHHHNAHTIGRGEGEVFEVMVNGVPHSSRLSLSSEYGTMHTRSSTL